MLNITISKPNKVFAEGTVVGSNYRLRWNTPEITSYPIKEYDIYINNIKVSTVSATEYIFSPPTTASFTYYIVAKDAAGISSEANIITVTNVPPSKVTDIKYTISGGEVVITWTSPIPNVNQYSIKSYEVYLNSTTNRIGEISGNIFKYVLPQGLTHTFYVEVIDALGRESGTVALPVNITPPALNISDITSSVVDNNVLLYWKDAQRDLPIYTYEIFKGNTFATAISLGTKTGLFTSVFETVAGQYTYWIQPIDVARNAGAAVPRTLSVSQPPDYILKVDENSTFTGTKSNIKVTDEGYLLGPVNTTETYTEHFTTNSWTTPQDQIDAEYPIYIQPSLTTGYYEETIDYGTVLAASKVTITPTYEAVSGVVGTNIDILLSTDNSTWVEFLNTNSIFATNFRYIKYKITLTASDNKELIKIISINIKLDQKLKSDGGKVSCLSTDGGTGASADVTLTSGSITGFTSIVEGSGYSSTVPPSINITGDGTGAQISAIVTGDAVTGFNILNAGTGYTTCTISISGEGTVVPWTSGISFTDISSISVTPQGTTAMLALYDFADIPNPTGFRILLLNPSTGARMSGTASWNVKGY